MKRLPLLLCFVLLLSACASPEPADAPKSTVIVSQQPAQTPEEPRELPEEEAPEELEVVGGMVEEQDKYVFLSDGVEIIPKEFYAPISANLPSPYETGEAPSCAFEGLDTLYRFEGYDIQCGLIRGEEVITGVFFVDETVSTPEGMKIGMSVEEMIDIYGTDFSEDFSKYTYSDGEVELIFVSEDNEIISISYLGLFHQ